MGTTEPQKFLSHKLIYETNFPITWGDDTVQAITAWVSVYDR